jgi:hypothetical protein
MTQLFCLPAYLVHPAQPIVAGSGNGNSGVPIEAGPENGHPDVLSVLSSLVGSNPTPAEATELVLTNLKLTMLMRATYGSTVRTNSSHLALLELSGNDDLPAHMMSSDKHLEMLEWLRACEFTLRTSDVREADCAVILLRHLKGAANRSFIKKHADTDVLTWYFKDAHEAIVALIPNHRAHFTERAFNIVFRAHALAEDVERYGLYLAHGETDPNGSSVIYRTTPELPVDLTRGSSGVAKGGKHLKQKESDALAPGERQKPKAGKAGRRGREKKKRLERT